MKVVSLSLTAAIVAIPLLASAGQGVPIAPGLRFESAVSTEAVFTDNMYRNSEDEVEATGFKLAPELGLYYAPTGAQYALTYQGELAEFDTSSEDDYMDHDIAANAAIRPYYEHAFDFELGYRMEHDDLGTVRTTGFTRVDNRELDKWENWSVGGKYTYGAESARLKWFLSGNVYDKEYTSNEEDIPGLLGTRFLSRQDVGVGTGITYELTAKSLLLAQIDRTEIEYDTDLPLSLDGTLTRGLLGYRWLATAKTSGEIWYGRYEREFDDGLRGTGKGDSWLVKVNWAPRTYSIIRLDAGISVHEAVLQGENFIERQTAGIYWGHHWSQRTSTFVRYRYTNDDFEGANREDDIQLYGVGGRYELTTHYMIKLEYAVQDRDSDITALDFDRNILTLSFDAVF